MGRGGPGGTIRSGHVRSSEQISNGFETWREVSYHVPVEAGIAADVVCVDVT